MSSFVERYGYRIYHSVFGGGNAAKAAELNAKAAIGIELPFLTAIPKDLFGTHGAVPESGPYSGYVNDAPPVASPIS